ncbi:MAG TPA: XdhC family protein [Candidatus Angelobacter sp.]|nr:XdhC family protein [Candidatus Angelobacter sp.]
MKTSELSAAGEAFAIALVVRCVPPSSGKPGDKAIVTSEGKIWGWIGGGCAQPVVVKEALKALREGRPRLVRISPDHEEGGQEGIVDYTMTCHSGGALDIYIEPVLAKPHLVILGRSPVARALARIAEVTNFAVSVPGLGSDPAALSSDGFSFPIHSQPNLDWSAARIAPGPDTYVVVSTQGEDDEGALLHAVSSNAFYVAFVASRTKVEKVFEYLREKGIAADRLASVHAPAGLDIPAASPEEIAVSILAEIIQVKGSRMPNASKPGKADKNGKTAEAGKPNETGKIEIGETKEIKDTKDMPAAAAHAPAPNHAKDPICGMSVNVDTAKYRSEHGGAQYYFCCAGCKQAFDKQPEKYALVVIG